MPMHKKTKKAIDTLLAAIRRAKPGLTGRAYKAAHEAESKLMVASGALKSTYKRKNKGKRSAKPKQKKDD